MTITDFAALYFPDISKKAVGARAKKLKVKPAKNKISTAHKLAISNCVKKSLTLQQEEYIREHANKISRKDIAKNLGISLYLVNTAFINLGIIINPEFTKKVHADKSREHIHLATTASVAKWKDDRFKAKRSEMISKQSKRLWEDERYRCKVRKGISDVYCNTDLKRRLSVIGKERYQNNPSVREILHAERPFKNSKLNDRVALILDSHGIAYEREFKIVNYRFDFKIGDLVVTPTQTGGSIQT